MSPRRIIDFHGVAISVWDAEGRVDALLAPRLRTFPEVAPGVDAEVAFHFEIGHPSAVASPTRARPVYDAVGGDVTYDDAEDRLYIRYGDALGACADLRTGVVRTILTHTATEACWLASHPFFTLMLLEQLKYRGLYALHAAHLARDGRAILIAGSSGAGKSTLSLALLRAGFDFGGDDMCFLRTDGEALRILAFSDEIDIAVRTAEFFPELVTLFGRPWRPGSEKWPLVPEEVYAVRYCRDSAPCALVFPRIGQERESRLERLDDAHALLELVPNVLLTHPARSQKHLDALAELIRRSSCWRLTTGRDFDTLPKMLDDTVFARTAAGP